MASIVGKRIGRHRWFAGSPKTVEGTAAFVVSIVTCASLLRVFGLVDDFSVRIHFERKDFSPSDTDRFFQIARYAGVVTLASAYEGFSDQNDNLTLPLYMWSMLVVFV